MKIHLVYLMLISAAIFADSSENNFIKTVDATEVNVTEDYSQNSRYLPAGKDLNDSKKTIYETLPEKRDYWDSTLSKIKAEEEELMPDVLAKWGRKK